MHDNVLQLINNMGHPVTIMGHPVPVDDCGVRVSLYSRVVYGIVYNVEAFMESSIVHSYRYPERFEATAFGLDMFIKAPVILSAVYMGYIPVICNPVDDEAFLLLWEKAHGR